MSQETQAVLSIEGELTIFRAAELKSQICAPTVTEINLAGVSEFDSAGLQLLMLAKKMALAQGRPLRLVEHSQAVLDVFELLQVAGYFGDPVVMDSPSKSAAGASRSFDGS